MVLGPIAVVGATSRVGSALIPLLLHSGYDVRPFVSRRGPDPRPLLDLWSLNEVECDRALAGCSIVVLLAAATPTSGSWSAMDYIRLNVMAPLALASWARQAGVKMLHLSGGIVYQHSSGRKLSEGDAIGYSGQGGTYGSSKLLAEIGLRPEVDLGLDLTVIRPSSLYGRRDLGLGLVSRLLSEAMQDGTITINEPTADRINLVHVDDVARAVALLIDNECNGAFNVSSSTQTLLEIATTCADVCGIDGVRVRPSISAARPGRHALDLSTAKIEAAVQWRPQVTLMEGLSQMRDTLLLAPKPSAAI